MFIKEINSLVLFIGIVFGLSVNASDVNTDAELEEYLRLIEEAGPDDADLLYLGKRFLDNADENYKPPCKKLYREPSALDIFDMDYNDIFLGINNSYEVNKENYPEINWSNIPKPKVLSEADIRNKNVSILELTPKLKEVQPSATTTSVYGLRLQGQTAAEGSVPKEYIIDLAEVSRSKNAPITEENINEYFLIVERALRKAIKKDPKILKFNIYVGETGNPAERKDQHVRDIRDTYNKKSVRARKLIKRKGPLSMNSFLHNVDKKWTKTFEALVGRVVGALKRGGGCNTIIGTAEGQNLVNVYWETETRLLTLSQEGLIKKRDPRPVILQKPSKAKRPKEKHGIVSVKMEDEQNLRFAPLLPRF